MLGRNNKDMMRYDVSTSFRGFFWYPPRGFDSWHTDGSLAQVRVFVCGKQREGERERERER